VDIGVTGLAGGPHVAENLADVALRAGHALMHPAQRIAGAVVIEFWNTANRLPTRKCVAIIARYDQRAVRTPCRDAWWRGAVLWRTHPRQREEQHLQHDREYFHQANIGRPSLVLPLTL